MTQFCTVSFDNIIKVILRKRVNINKQEILAKRKLKGDYCNSLKVILGKEMIIEYLSSPKHNV